MFLSFLPLSHAYEHTAGQFLPIAVGAQIYYADGLETLATNLLEARPTIMVCVPRLYEVHAPAHPQCGRAPARPQAEAVRPRRSSSAARPIEQPDALDAGRAAARSPARPAGPPSRSRARFGGRIKALVSGGAPLNPEVGLFFTALGLPVFQGYGQTECAPVVSVNTPRRVKLHTVGPPLPGIEVRIAADGEILVRGDSVMQGYWRDPEATAETLKDGWLHTGDIGLIDEDGFIQITDRKKDIIVNSGGDNLAPQRVEGVLLLQPEIGQAIVYGDRRPHLVALIVPDAGVRQELCPQASAAGPISPAWSSRRTSRARSTRRCGAPIASLSPLERVRHFRVIAEPFSIENGLMTPTMKLKRQVIYRTHRELFEELYEARH